MTQIDPPTIDLEPVPDRLTNVTVRNDAGEVIYDGTPARFEETTVQPEAGTFDGTLEIEWQSRKGESGTQTLTHDPEKSIELDFDWDDHTFSLTEKPRGLTPYTGIGYNAFGGYLRRSFTGTGAFTDVAGGEKAMLEVDDAEGFRVGGRLSYDFGGGMVEIPDEGAPPQTSGGILDPTRIMFDWQYWEADGDAERTVAPGEGELAVTFPFETDGSTGLGFSGTGGEAEMDFESRGLDFGIQAGFSQHYGTSPSGEEGDLEAYYSYGLRFSYQGFDTDARLQNLTLPDVMSRDVTEVDEFRIGPTLGARLDLEMSPNFAPFIGSSVYLYHRWANLDGEQQTTAPGILTPAQQEPIEYSDDDSGIGARFTAELGFESNFTENFSVEAKGFFAYDTATSFVDKRDNPSDDANAIDTDEGLDYGVMAGVQLKF